MKKGNYSSLCVTSKNLLGAVGHSHVHNSRSLFSNVGFKSYTHSFSKNVRNFVDFFP